MLERKFGVNLLEFLTFSLYQKIPIFLEPDIDWRERFAFE